MTYYDLGAYTRSITTKSPDAQIWFDRGLNCQTLRVSTGCCWHVPVSDRLRRVLD